MQTYSNNQIYRNSITEFRGEYYFLSNLFPAVITYNNAHYANNEAA